MNTKEEKKTAAQYAAEAPTYTPTTYKEGANVTAAKEQLDSLAKPTQYKSKWQEKIDGTVDKILNREEFSYDVNGDALYKQYADQYARNGKTAMEDTIARASAMTGGYGNSYAQTAGQAAYATEMQKLNDVIPELYQLALDKYTREGETLRDNYAMLSDAENTDYSRHRDGVNDYLTERDYLTGVYNDERNFDYGKWSDTQDAQRYAFDVNRDNYQKRVDLEREDEATQYDRTKDSKNELIDAILSGYNPTDDELAAVGLTREQADVYLNEWTKSTQSDEYNTLADRISQTGYEPTDEELAVAGMTRGEAESYAKQYSLGMQELVNSAYPTKPIVTVDEKELYGGYTRAEYTDKLLEISETAGVTGDIGAAAGLAKSAGTDEAKAVFKAIFGVSAYEEYFLEDIPYTTAMSAFDSAVMNEREYAQRGGNKVYGSYLGYIEDTANKWIDEGKITEDEAIYLVATYEDKLSNGEG